MNIEHLTLDLKQFARIQEALNLIDLVALAEKRSEPIYTSLRSNLIEAADHLRRAREAYNLLIEGQERRRN
jgi:hypothetical protein